MTSPETRTDNPPPAMPRAELERRLKRLVECNPKEPEEFRACLFALEVDGDSEAARAHNIFIGDLIGGDEDPRALIDRHYGAASCS